MKQIVCPVEADGCRTACAVRERSRVALKARRRRPFFLVAGRRPGRTEKTAIMFRRQKDIDARNREMEALAERWELRIHAIALALTAVVLAMRLVAGRQDLTSDTGWEETGSSSAETTTAANGGVP
jgi:hypothetical protein